MLFNALGQLATEARCPLRLREMVVDTVEATQKRPLSSLVPGSWWCHRSVAVRVDASVPVRRFISEQPLHVEDVFTTLCALALHRKARSRHDLRLIVSIR